MQTCVVPNRKVKHLYKYIRVYKKMLIYIIELFHFNCIALQYANITETVIETSDDIS